MHTDHFLIEEDQNHPHIDVMIKINIAVDVIAEVQKGLEKIEATAEVDQVHTEVVNNLEVEVHTKEKMVIIKEEVDLVHPQDTIIEDHLDNTAADNIVDQDHHLEEESIILLEFVLIFKKENVIVLYVNFHMI